MNHLFLKIVMNGGPGSGNFNPGQGRGVGKPGNGSTTFGQYAKRHKWALYSGDEITVKIGDKVHAGTLEYKDGKRYVNVNGESIEIPDDAKRTIEVTETVQSKKKKEQIAALAQEGIVQKSPKERRTKKQKELISDLSDKGLLNEWMKEWLSKYGDEKFLGEIKTSIDEVESLGINTSNLTLDKLRSGSKKWGTAAIDRDYANNSVKYELNFIGTLYDGDPLQTKIVETTKKGFHTNDSTEGVVRHEVGHYVSYVLANQGKNVTSTTVAHDNAAEYCTDVIVRAAGGDLEFKTPRTVTMSKKVKEGISEYGLKDSYEVVAESWSNPNYSQLTKNIVDIMKSDIKEMKKNNSMNLVFTEDGALEICSGYGPEDEDE